MMRRSLGFVALLVALFPLQHAWALTLSEGLPAFDRAGFLPPGMHRTSFPDFAARYASTPRRRALVGRLEVTFADLAAAGWSRVYVGGSFVSDKAKPGDVDVLIPRQKGVACDKLVRVAKRERPNDLHFYGARKIVTNAFEKQITPAQKQAWQIRKPDFMQFFSQNRAGKQVGMVVVELAGMKKPRLR